MQEVVIESEFKGNPILGLKLAPEDERPMIQFGVKKAKLIVGHINAIRSFAEKHS